MEHALTYGLAGDGRAGTGDRPELMLLLSAGDEHYTLNARAVTAVIVAVELTPLAGVPNAVVGLVNHHGRMVPVVDLCRLMQGRDCKDLLSTRIVMLRHPPESASASSVGLRAERVTHCCWAEPAELTSAEGAYSDATYLRRIAGQRTEMVSVLCLDRLLKDVLRLNSPSDPAQEA